MHQNCSVVWPIYIHEVHITSAIFSSLWNFLRVSGYSKIILDFPFVCEHLVVFSPFVKKCVFEIALAFTNRLRSRSIISLSAYGWVLRLDIHHKYAFQFKLAIVPYSKQLAHSHHAFSDRKIYDSNNLLQRREHGTTETQSIAIKAYYANLR